MTTNLLTRHQVPKTGSAAAAGLPPGGTGRASAYSFAEGDFGITVLSDGYISIPGEVLVPGKTSDERAKELDRIGASDDVVQVQCNIPLIRKGHDLILVDTGSGRKYQPTDGQLAQNLRAVGVDPAAITKVVFSHAHPDHIWGTLAEDGALRFTNAT